MESRFSLFFLINNDTICDIVYWGGERVNKVHSVTVDYDNGKLIVNGKEINNTAIIGVADESTEGWLRQKVINIHNEAEKMIKVSVYCEEVHPKAEEPLANSSNAGNKP